jgi:hypothetical protein
MIFCASLEMLLSTVRALGRELKMGCRGDKSF